MKKSLEAINKVIKSTQPHIMEAQAMAAAIYKNTPDKHTDMLKEVKCHLELLHDMEARKIRDI